MSDAAARNIYTIMAAVTFATMVMSLRGHKGKSLFGVFMFYSAMTLGWQLADIFRYVANDPEWIHFIYTLILPFVALTSLGAFVFVLRFYGMEKYYSGAILLSLCVCPAITTAMALFFYKSDFLESGYKLIAVSPELIIESTHGPWFWLHAVYCYVLIMIAFVTAITKHRGLPKAHRRTSLVLLVGMIVSVSCSCLNVSGIYKAPVDLALVGITFCGVFMYVAARQNHGLEYVYTARRGIFNSLNEALFILDNERRIISRNQAAHGLMLKMGLSASENRFSALDAKIFPVDLISSDDEESGVDFILANEIFNMREKMILDRKQRAMGYFVSIKNVDQNRRMISRLEQEAGMDSLTGIFNRMRMERMRKALDNADNYPIAVICGDMNGLKEINDTHGHQQGDVLLMAGAEALVSSCPPSACIGRMGGDEFLVLLPGYSETRAHELIGEIEERMRRADEYPYEVSMSLGVAVKTNIAQDLEEIINLADSRMYEKKRFYKESRGQRPPRRQLPLSGM